MSDHNNKTHRQIIAFNKDIGHSYVPNLNARLLDDHGGYFIKTNSQGFRSDKEFSKKKSGRRILFLATLTQQQMEFVIKIGTQT